MWPNTGLGFNKIKLVSDVVKSPLGEDESHPVSHGKYPNRLQNDSLCERGISENVDQPGAAQMLLRKPATPSLLQSRDSLLCWGGGPIIWPILNGISCLQMYFTLFQRSFLGRSCFLLGKLETY